MASIKDLKKRITTVKNTQLTTRAMKMVSAAKLRRAQDAILNQRPYSRQVQGLIQKVASSMTIADNQFPLLSQVSGKEPGLKRILLVMVTSDRGLCGGFNSNVIKKCQKWVLDQGKQFESVEFAYVGRRGHDFFKSKKAKPGTYYSEVSGKMTWSHARKLSEQLMGRFLKNEFDEIKFVYNEFKNAAMQEIVVESFLPYDLESGASGTGSKGTSAVHEGAVCDFIVQPGKAEVLAELLERNFSIQTFRILLESQASEHGARMSAMENATKNAGEMIRKLTLQYNKQRQAGITKELLEIISGSESQKA